MRDEAYRGFACMLLDCPGPTQCARLLRRSRRTTRPGFALLPASNSLVTNVGNVRVPTDALVAPVSPGHAMGEHESKPEGVEDELSQCPSDKPSLLHPLYVRDVLEARRPPVFPDP